MQNMNVSQGGVGGMLHDTIIQEVAPHLRILDMGKEQVMYFLEGNDGPVWMTLTLGAETKHGRQLGTAKSRAKTKIELLKEMQQSGYYMTQQ
jgi:hypothetical protein